MPTNCYRQLDRVVIIEPSNKAALNKSANKHHVRSKL